MNKHYLSRTFLRTLIFLLFCCCSSFMLQAQTNVWIGNSPSWADPTNWSLGAVPGTGQTVIISNAPNGGNFPVYDASPILDYAIQNFGTVTFASVVYNTGALINGANASMVNNTQFVNAGMVTFDNDGLFNNNGALDNYGIFDNGGPGSAPAIFNNNSGSTIQNFGTFRNTAILNNDGTIINQGTIRSTNNLQNTGSISNFGLVDNPAGSMFNNAAGATVNNVTGSEFRHNGALPNDGTIDNNGIFTVQNVGTLSNANTFINNNELRISGLFDNNNTLTNNGIISIANGGTLENNSNTQNNGTIETAICGIIIQNSGTTMSGPVLNDGIIYLLNGNVTGIDNLDFGEVFNNINDKKPPVAGCRPGVVLTLDANNEVIAVPDDVDKGGYGQCGATIENRTVEPNTFGINDLGQQVVTLTMFDSNGNTSECDAIITIIEPTPPIVAIDDPDISANCPNDVQVTALAGASSATATWVEPTATTNCLVGGGGGGGNTSPICAIRTASNIHQCNSNRDYGFYLALDGYDYNYSVSNAQFVEYEDGTANFTGTITNLTTSTIIFNVNVDFSGRTTSTPPDSPKVPVCVTPNTDDWYYYTGINGTLVGASAADGAILNVTRFGEAFQIGVGASIWDDQLEIGASAWLSVNVVNQPISGPTLTPVTTSNGQEGDINIRLTGNSNPCNIGVDCSQVQENIANFIYMGKHNGSKYYCTTASDLTWSQANTLTNNSGGHLAVVNNQAENDFIQNNLLTTYGWIGFEDGDGNGTYQWVDGSPVNYTNWNDGEPNESGPTYVRLLQSNGKWTDRNAAFTGEAVMEIPCPNTPPVTPPACNAINDQIHGFDYMGQYNNSKYFASNGTYTWHQGFDIANALGGYLAVIGDQAENDFIQTNMTQSTAWIGYEDDEGNGSYDWVNGLFSSFVNWNDGEPNGSGPHFARILQSNGKWTDRLSSFQIQIIVEIPCGSEPDEPVPGDLSIQQISGPSSGNLFPLGTTPVAYRITDECGNEEVCVFDVEIIETPAEITLNCPANIVVSTLPGAPTATANWTEPTGSSTCFNDGFQQQRSDEGPANGGAFPIGSTFVSYSALDSCFNFAGCTFTVTVNATPTNLTLLTCPEDIFINTSSPTQVSWNEPTATSDCFSGNLSIEQIVGPANNTTLDVGEYQVIYLIRDDCGNTEICFFNITVGCQETGDACDDGDPCTVNDAIDEDCNCTGLYQDSDSDGVCDTQDICEGFDDNADADGDGIPDGCDDNQCFCGVGGDDTPPVFDFIPTPGPFFVNCDADLVRFDPSALDNCDGNVEVIFTETITDGACEDTYTLTWTWTATDMCGNEVQTSTIYEVSDQTAPVLIGVPADVTVNFDAIPNVPAEGTITATDDCDTDVPVTFEEVQLSLEGDCTDDYTITRIWMGIDNCGNSVSGTQVITVIGELIDSDGDGVCDRDDICEGFDDNQDGDGDGIPDGCDNNNCFCGNGGDETAPVFTSFPTNALVDCDNVPTAPGLTASDDCDTNVTIAFEEVRTDGTCEYNYTLTRTWTATDDCGNEATVTQVIEVLDQTPPVLNNIPIDTMVNFDAIPTPPDITANVDANSTPLEIVVTDNCDTSAAVNFQEIQLFLEGNCTDDYTLTRIWTAIDACGNSTEATQVITVIGELIDTDGDGVCDRDDICEGFDDNQDGDNDGIPDGCDDGNCFCGTNGDETAPVLVGIPADITVECDETIFPNNVTATDDCDTDVVIEFDETRADGVCPDTYTLTRTWTATDDCGNQSMGTQVIEVIDETAPFLNNIPADVTVNFDSIPTSAFVWVTDNCDNDGSFNFTEVQVFLGGDCTDDYTLTRTWITTDNCGNSREATQVITVIGELIDSDGDGVCDRDDICAGFDDNQDGDGDGIPDGCDEGNCFCGANGDETAPVLVGIPPDTTVECDEISLPNNVTATDDCDTDVEVLLSEEQVISSCLNEFTIIRTWTATDDCGNNTTASQIIIVQDTTTPTFLTIPADVTVTSSTIPSDSPTIEDNCDTAPILTLDEVQVFADNNCTDDYTLTRTWTVTDACGNASMATQVITVIGDIIDNDGDGVCNAEDMCEGFDDNIDTDGDGIPDGCDTPGCEDFNLSGTVTDISCNGANDGSIDLVLPCTPGSGGGGSGTSGNLAEGKPATQSSTNGTATADLAVDGNTSGVWWADYSVSSTSWTSQPYWEVDLGENATIDNIEVWGRTDCCQSFLSNYHVLISDVPFTSASLSGAQAEASADFPQAGGVGGQTIIPTNTTGRYVRIQLSGAAMLQLAEVKVNGSTGGGGDPDCDLTIAWDNSLGDIEDPNGLSPGFYTVTVTSADGCIATQGFAVNEPQELTVFRTVTEISATNANDGAATLTSSGGTPPYSYQWSHGPTTATVTGLAPGDYSYTVTDANGCTDSNSFSLTNPGDPCSEFFCTAFDLSAETCAGGEQPDAVVNVDNGSGDYSYLWSDGQTTARARDLAPGTYGVTVTDNVTGCVCTSEATVFYGIELTCDATVTNPISAQGASDGEATATSPGIGVGSESYLWSDGQTTATAVGLSAGTYTVTVTSNTFLCTCESSVTLTDPNGPGCEDFIVTGIATDISCFGENDGSIILDLPCTPDAGGGADNLAEGKPAIQSSNNGTATADLAVDGNTSGNWWADFSVSSTSWTHQPYWEVDLGAVSSISQVEVWGRTDCCQGFLSNYHVLISDTPFTATNLNGAINETNADFPQAGGVGGQTIIPTNTTGRYVRIQLSGAAMLQLAEVKVIGGGTGSGDGCTITWDNGLGNTTNPENLSAGAYNVSVSNDEGCESTARFVIHEPTPLTCEATGLDASAAGADDGVAMVVADGGIAPYTYLWNHGKNTATIEDLTPDDYGVTVTDANGCTCESSVTISEPVCQGCSSITLTCPNNITTTQTDDNGAVVYWPAPTATTDCAISALVDLQQTEGLANNSIFPIGETTVSYTATDDCGSTATCTFMVTVVENTGGGEMPEGYCHAQGNAPWIEWITGVEFGDINNVANNGKDLYGDYTDMSTTVLTGESYPITLTPGFSWTMYDEHWSVWIDFNRDGDLDDAGELVLQANSSTTVIGAIAIPATASEGTTLMRISMQRGAYVDDPCETFSNGEVEDYAVNIVQGTNFTNGGTGQFLAAPSSPTNVSIKEMAFHLFPNPTQAAAQLDLSALIGKEKVEVQIFDHIGHVVKTVNIAEVQQASHALDLSDFASGIYFVTVQVDGVSSLPMKLVVL